MNILDNLKLAAAERRLNEETIFAAVLRELESGTRRDGLWAKAISESSTEHQARALYIKYRVQAVNDELAMLNAIDARVAEGQKAEAEARAVAGEKAAQAAVALKEKALRQEVLDNGPRMYLEDEQAWQSLPTSIRKSIKFHRGWKLLATGLVLGAFSTTPYAFGPVSGVIAFVSMAMTVPTAFCIYKGFSNLFSAISSNPSRT